MTNTQNGEYEINGGKFIACRCDKCSTVFLISLELNNLAKYRAPRMDIWCPNGHPLLYLSEATVVRFQELEAERDKYQTLMRERMREVDEITIKFEMAQTTIRKLKKKTTPNPGERTAGEE